MIVETAAALPLIKSAIDIVKGVKDVADSTTIQELKVRLLGELVAAQEAQLAQQERYREAIEEVAQLRAWQNEKHRYQLLEIVPGGFAYSLKKEERGAERAHCLCANCYADGKKSFLQVTSVRGKGCVFQCNRCGASFSFQYWSDMPPANWAEGVEFNGSGG